MFKRLGLSLVLIAYATVASAQEWPNIPIIGGASYCSSMVNGHCSNTVAAGPAKTGLETVPADTNASQGQSPQTAKLSLASLNALPITVVPVTTPPAAVSASNLSGGVLYTSTTTITAATVGLPIAPFDQQQYTISSNRTITTLTVVAGSSATLIGSNSNPTVLTASTTAPQGYKFIYNAPDTSWYRLQ